MWDWLAEAVGLYECPVRRSSRLGPLTRMLHFSPRGAAGQCVAVSSSQSISHLLSFVSKRLMTRDHCKGLKAQAYKDSGHGGKRKSLSHGRGCSHARIQGIWLFPHFDQHHACIKTHSDQISHISISIIRNCQSSDDHKHDHDTIRND